MVKVYVGLGANLGNPAQTLSAVLNDLRQADFVDDLVSSSLYASKPMGPQDQPDYVNAVARFNTDLPPIALLDALQGLEQDYGRVRGQRWGARTLDIDILLYGDQRLSLPRLTVPHSGLELREFVVVPLAEIAPDLDLPSGNSVKSLAQSISQNGLQRIAPPPAEHP
ncbi:2-amino-4-hydroxy-6-hydroxymethyldihydropteridine diphosphokinase [Aliidiomarina halalkaliphila]|uniref:2-amino-4-hydroxy-6-hydroxymethyldihydropteridine pyrophosphokinase n=1 Tax=Aliidiomarina halalkaliphila TaxID=2593535 RepID=A0A552WZC9_9GAMM|nr:2-amino-4-hydroxy-6-hydroxymethyldihydropteridine diphosphokinase [Aliidiomarina halalkaliphila]TRW48172.1 2-amino-4-hydroxy-6-hydroxymethyldihydropteridine diphosphokinase [Aliidiomarina halalkaliphila]